MKIKIIIILLSLVFSFGLFSKIYAQSDFKQESYILYLDSVLGRSDDTIVNPLFLPAVFTGKILPDQMIFYSPINKKDSIDYGFPVYKNQLFEDKIYINEMQKKAYHYLARYYPESVKYIAAELPKDIPQTMEMKVNPYRDLFKVEPPSSYNHQRGPRKFMPKIHNYRIAFEHSLQFSQNYISPNWYKGGQSNLNLLSYNKFSHKYEKGKVSIENRVEYKLSIYTSATDSLRKYKIGDDVFAINSSYGYKAFNKWYYTINGAFWTQFFNNYYENRNDLKSASFLSPLNLNIGLGMEYKLEKKFKNNKYKKLNATASISPLSFNYRYINDPAVDRSKYGLKPGQKALSTFGSKINATMQFDFNRNVSWISELYYFTSYEKVESEFRNTLNMAVNRYFSTKIYCNVRYDDSVKKKNPDDSYFQFYEVLSFGFNYKW